MSVATRGPSVVRPGIGTRRAAFALADAEPTPDPEPTPAAGPAPDVAMAVLLAVIALTRYRVLVAGSAPATVDSGNWLAYGHALLGASVRDPSITYPPLVPLLVTGATAALGPVVAIALVGALCSIVPAAGTWWAVRTGTTSPTARWLLVPLVGLLAVAGATGEATAWGGFPQLLGTGLTPVLLVLVDRLLRRNRAADVARAAAVLLVLAATSHFAATFAVLAVGVLVVLTIAARPGGDRWSWTRSRLPSLTAMGLPCLALLPWYRPLIRAMAGNPVGDTEATLTRDNVLRWIEFTYRDQPILWRALLVAGLAAPALLWSQRGVPSWRLAASATSAVILGSVLSREARFLVFLPLVAVLGIAAWLSIEVASAGRPKARTRTATWSGVALTAALAVQAASGHRYFPEQRAFYGIVDRDVHEALRWLHDETPTDTVVGVSTVDGAPLGWWVEGLAERQTIYASPLQWLVHPDEQTRARLANDLFDDRFPTRAAVARSRTEGIDLVVLPLSSGHIDPTTVDAFIAEHPELVRFRNDGVVVFATDLDEPGLDEAGAP